MQNGIDFDGSIAAIGTTTVPIVQRYNATNTTALGPWQLLNPAAGCRNLTAVTLTADQAASIGADTPQCQQDLIRDYAEIAPKQNRFGISTHGTFKIGDRAQAYAEINYYQNKVLATGLSARPIRARTTPGETGVTFSTANLALPIYVCTARVNCSAANGTLNPNNPFAALGQVARIRYRLADRTPSNDYLSKSLRAAAGLSGSFGNNWNYVADITTMKTDLTNTANGYIFVQHLLDVVADGSYNFVDPARSTAAVRDYLTPTSIQKSKSEISQLQASLSKSLYNLQGGDLQLGVGASVRRESINNPSANSDANGPRNRYFTINPFGSEGSRTVSSAYFELNAPVLSKLELNLSGRQDRYSSGQSSFSPKIGAKFTPFKQLAIRGTFSKGFRIPSFAESGALPTTGFLTVNAPASFQSLHGNNTYGQGYALGLTTVGTRGLKPEKARNFTVGLVFEPTKALSFTADFYKIDKANVITGADYTVAADAYYAGRPIPAGFVVTPGLPDPAFPNALPTIGFIASGFINANKQNTSGVDVTMSTKVSLGNGVKWTSTLEATHVINYDQTFPSGVVQHYAGTLGPYQITSASGTPQLRGSWQNSFEIGRLSLTATANYTSGYELTAEDNGATKGDCLGGAAFGTPATYIDGTTPILCRTSPFVDVNFNADFSVTDKLDVYVNVSNAFDKKPPLDPTTYGAYQYNPAWANAGIIGRSISLGVKFAL